jgi:hypothetical protein
VGYVRRLQKINTAHFFQAGLLELMVVLSRCGFFVGSAQDNASAGRKLGEALKLFRRAIGTMQAWKMNLPIDDCLWLLYLPCATKKYSAPLSLGLTEYYKYITHYLLSIPPHHHIHLSRRAGCDILAYRGKRTTISHARFKADLSKWKVW